MNFYQTMQDNQTKDGSHINVEDVTYITISELQRHLDYYSRLAILSWLATEQSHMLATEILNQYDPQDGSIYKAVDKAITTLNTEPSYFYQIR